MKLEQNAQKNKLMLSFKEIALNLGLEDIRNKILSLRLRNYVAILFLNNQNMFWRTIIFLSHLLRNKIKHGLNYLTNKRNSQQRRKRRRLKTQELELWIWWRKCMKMETKTWRELLLKLGPRLMIRKEKSQIFLTDTISLRNDLCHLSYRRDFEYKNHVLLKKPEKIPFFFFFLLISIFY